METNSLQDSAYRAIFEASSDGLVINDAETGLVLEANPAFCRMHGYDRMTGLHPTTFIHPASHGLFEEYLRAVRTGEEFRAQAQDVRRDGSVFDIEVLGRGFTYQGRFALLGVVRDVTEQVRAYSDLEERVAARTREIERRRQVAEALSELLTVLNSRRALDEMLAAILAQAVRLLGSDAEALYLIDTRNPNVLRLHASRNLPPNAEPPSVAIETPVMGMAAQRRRPVVAPDLHQLMSEPLVATVEEQVQDRGTYLELIRRGPATVADPSREKEQLVMSALFRSVLAVPLLARGNCYGSLLLSYREPHVPSDEELELIGTFAGHAGLAIENARLQAQSEQRRLEVDRRRQVAEGLRDLVAIVNSARTLDEVLQEIAAQASELLASDASAIYLPDSSADDVRFRACAWVGLDAAYANASIPHRVSATGLAVDRRRSVAIYDVLAALPADPDAEFEPVLEDKGSHFRAVCLPTPHAPFGPDSDRVRRLGAYAAGYRALVAVPLAVKDEVYGALTLYFREVHEFGDDEVELAAAFAEQAALAMENARLHETSELQRQELEALYGADEALHRSLRLQDVLDALVDTAISLFHAHGVGLWSWDPQDARKSVPLAARGLSDEYLEQTMRMSDEPAVLDYWWSRETFAVENISCESLMPESQRIALEREGWRALLSTQIRVGDEAFGSFTVGFHTQHRFTEQERRLLSALAQRAGVAIQNARLYEQAQQAATLEERQRLARELHDAVTQTLFSTALIADVVPDLWEVDPSEGRQRLADLRRLTRGALAEMRALLVELRPGALTELSLGDLLRQLADATASRTRLEVGALIEGQPRSLPASVQVALYRIAQEALNNVVKHAQAHHTRVELIYEQDGLRMRIADDGRGFGFEQDPRSIPAGHLGLRIMRERAEALGARFELTSRPGAGTSIEIYWRQMEDATA